MTTLIKITKWRPLPHIIFWLASMYFIGSYFSISGTLSTVDFIYALCFHFCLVPLTYLNLGVLIPKFLQIQRYTAYLIGLSVNLLLAVVTHNLIFDFLVPLLFSNYYIVSFVETTSLLMVFLIYLGFTSLLKFSKSWFKIQQIEKENIQFQLDSLKAQLNPHFLFNGLNSIYALSLKNSEKTPEAILILSELLRFSLYEINKERVELSQEIRNIEHFLSLQELRLKKPELIEISIIGNAKDIKVPPMIFLPILENAFKHGDIKKTIRISLKTSETVSFYCENYIDQKDHPENLSGGIGLQNIKKRLDLIYPDASLEIKRENNQFMVHIKFTVV